jgi:hypothetical protein
MKYKVGDYIYTKEKAPGGGYAEARITNVYGEWYDIEYINNTSPYKNNKNNIGEMWVLSSMNTMAIKQSIKKVTL